MNLLIKFCQNTTIQQSVCVETVKQAGCRKPNHICWKFYEC